MVGETWSALALVAGGFLAVAEQVLEGEVPLALSCLPMCVKYGCDSPETLAWFRFGVRLRRPSRLLASRFPPPGLQSDEELTSWVQSARRRWLASSFADYDDDPDANVLAALLLIHHELAHFGSLCRRIGIGKCPDWSGEGRTRPMADEPVNMDDRIRPGLQRLATWPVVILTMLAALLCLAGFQWREARLGGLELLDTRQWYTPEQAAALFGALDRLDSRARAVYAWTEVSIDMIFPVAYGLLLALLLLRVFEDGRFYLLPIAGAATDVFENISIALLASTYDGPPSSDESGGGLHAAEEWADPGDAGYGGGWRDSMAVGRSTPLIQDMPRPSFQ